MRKTVSALLIFSVILSFCIFSFPVNAIATETMIIGGIITAFAGATGAYILGDNLTDGALSQYLYDRFQDFGNRIEVDNLIINTIAGTTIENGKLKINNTISKILSRFINEDLQEKTISMYSYDFGDYIINVPNTHFLDTYKITGHVAKILMYSDGINWIDKNVPLVFNGHVIDLSRIPPGNQGNIYIDGQPYTVNYSTSIPISGKPIGAQRIMGNYPNKYAFVSNNGYFSIIKTGTSEKVTGNDAYTDYSGMVTNVQGTLYSFWSKINQGVSSPVIQATIEPAISLPSETIKDDENTYVSIGSDIPITSVDDFAQAALDQTVDGTLTAEYENAVTLDPIAPETHLGWVTSLHGIWYYVQHLIETGTNGIKRIAQIQNAIPQETLFCIYGGVVLLLFGGVISRLLL